MPVIRAEDFYLPPPSMPPDAWQLMMPAECAIAWYEHKQQRRLPRPEGVLLGPPQYARIDAARWVADCHNCGSAQVVTPTDPRLYCVECVSGWYTITFPADVAAAEQAVAELPAQTAFWWHPDDTRAWNRPPAPAAPTDKELATGETAAPGNEEGS